MSYYNPPAVMVQQTYDPYMQPQTAIQMPAAYGVQRENKWSWTAFILSAVGMCLACFPVSFVGLLCSMTAYVDHKSGDFVRSKRKRSCAMGWAIAGIVLGVIMLIVVIGTSAGVTTANAAKAVGGAFEDTD